MQHVTKTEKRWKKMHLCILLALLLLLTACTAQAINSSGQTTGMAMPTNSMPGATSTALSQVTEIPTTFPTLGPIVNPAIPPTVSPTPVPTSQPTPGLTASVQSTPPSGVSASSGQRGSSANQIAWAVFLAINQSRAEVGRPALQWNGALQQSAHQHNLAMDSADEMSHQLQGEDDPGTRMSQQGVQWTWYGENIGYNGVMTVSGALVLHREMMNERPPDDGHRENILTTSGNEVGVDVLLDSQEHILWLTEDFAEV